MSRYFRYFPRIKYGNSGAVDLTRRVSVRDTLLKNPYLYLPYTIQDDMRPEELAYLYYGDASLVWLIYFANDIIDPYYQWPMSQNIFDSYIIQKYGTKKDNGEYYRSVGTTQTFIDSTGDSLLTNLGDVFIVPTANEKISGFDIVQWAQDTRIDDNVVYYENQYGDKISNDTYKSEPSIVVSEWTPIRVYDYEFKKNEEKRNIFMIDKQYARQTEREIRELLNIG